MNRPALYYATTVGTLAQLAMVIAGHYVAFIRDDVFALGGMAISLVAGILYARRVNEPWGERAQGGAIAGGVCAFIAIALSAILKDTLLPILAVGTLASAFTGMIGGVAGGWMGKRSTSPKNSIPNKRVIPANSGDPEDRRT
jgi:hypothetical protein